MINLSSAQGKIYLLQTIHPGSLYGTYTDKVVLLQYPPLQFLKAYCTFPASLLSTSSLQVIIGFVKHITRHISMPSRGTNTEHIWHLSYPNIHHDRFAVKELITRHGQRGPL